jgi:hypothetical protein
MNAPANGFLGRRMRAKYKAARPVFAHPTGPEPEALAPATRATLPVAVVAFLVAVGSPPTKGQ